MADIDYTDPAFISSLEELKDRKRHEMEVITGYIEYCGLADKAVGELAEFFVLHPSELERVKAAYEERKGLQALFGPVEAVCKGIVGGLQKAAGSAEGDGKRRYDLGDRMRNIMAEEARDYTVAELSQRTGAPCNSVIYRLHVLERRGLVILTKTRMGGKGQHMLTAHLAPVSDVQEPCVPAEDEEEKEEEVSPVTPQTPVEQSVGQPAEPAVEGKPQLTARDIPPEGIVALLRAVYRRSMHNGYIGLHDAKDEVLAACPGLADRYDVLSACAAVKELMNSFCRPGSTKYGAVLRLHHEPGQPDGNTFEARNENMKRMAKARGWN